MSHGNETPKLIEVIFPTTRILDAVTVAKLTQSKPDMKIGRGIVTTHEQALPHCNLLLESLVQAYLFAAGPVSQDFGIRTAGLRIVCSQERLDWWGRQAGRLDNPYVVVAMPFRFLEMPRDSKTKFLEPFVMIDDEPGPNPEWLSAPWELEFHVDRSKVFYDMIPIQLFQRPNDFYFMYSGELTLVEDAVQAVAVRRVAAPASMPVCQ